MSDYQGKELELSSLVLPLPPSCVAFSPEHPNLVVIGTYFLDKTEDHASRAQSASIDDDEEQSTATKSGPQTRSGSLILFRLDSGTLREVSTTPSASGILDIAFSPHDPSLLCAATSTGSLTFHRLTTSSLQQTHVLQAFDSSILVLDLEFHPSQPNVIGVTLSNGEITLVRLSQSLEAVESTETIYTHSLEAWTLSFSPDGALYSGADSAVLHAHPSGLSDSRTHGAGVTAIVPLSTENERQLLMTGSYDDTLRVIALQRGRRTQTLLELDLGGGVWRLKPIQSTAGQWTVLASCMHAGCAIVRVTCNDWTGEQESWDAEIVQRFTRHQSMNYGSDAVVHNGKATVVSSSFYDKLVCVWGVDIA